MFKTLTIAAFSTMLATSAYAECTKVDMDKMDAQIKTMTDKTKQDAAMKEMKMAEDMMTKKDMKACTMHMESATKAMDTKKM